MANIRKTFNFRAGVKVDDSVLVVAGARVGIGSTTPTKTFDVNGNAIFNGQLVSSKLLVSGISTFNDDIEGDGATNISGINSVTATKFYGDSSGLDNLPTSQWIDTDVGLGFTSIYAAGNVGVGTTDPRFTMQIGSNPRIVGEKGVGIDGPSGNIRSSGIITATSFDGSLLGAGAVSNSSQTNIKTLGTLTGLSVDGNAGIGSLNVTGVSTLGVTTFTGNVSFGSSALFGDDDKILLGNSADLEIFHDATSGINDGRIVDKIGHLKLETSTDKNIYLKTGATQKNNLIAKATEGVELNYDGNLRLSTTGVGVTVYNQLDTDRVVSGVGSFGSIGIGTTNPATDFQIVNSENAVITLGRDSTATGNNGAISFGKTTTGFPYSNANSLDIINYGIGNVNFYLEAGTLGATTGDFFWHKRGNHSRLMTLTNDGKLGIGITQPVNNLHVVGTSTVTDNAFFGSDVEVKGDLNVTQGLTVGSFTVTTLNANVSGTLDGNVNATSGLSTFTKAKVTTSLGINTDAPANGIALNSEDSKVFVTSGGYIGIKTTSESFYGINASDTSATVSKVGVGTLTLRSVCDFGSAGATSNNPDANITGRFMIPPSVDSTQRSALTSLVPGALIYNTTSNKLNVYNGSAWREVSDGAV